ncbi:DUF427 domain-containing protein [Microscilla marina]|uniref:DUF427 domain-containing protein n=1 Tax=Microscilla marina ATCC 23134 TaxID=313606 RepID=A1ZPA4_MICM2|nr:DUF427 domain-containing protein [Microscilla marina]EAY27896.1 conserved hypothetical protein [Microscilla marina ATCC 23134]
MKAIWNGEVIAESNDTVVIEGNHYFPKNSIKSEFYQNSDHKTNCFWKGEASYYTLAVNGEKNVDAAWYYPTPKDAAEGIKDHVSFWKGVEITE